MLTYHNSVYFKKGYYFYAEAVTVGAESNQVTNAPYQEYPGAFQLHNIEKISMNDVQVKGLAANYGGAISITLDKNFKGLYRVTTYVLDNVRVSGCFAAYDGGALFLKNLRYVSIENSDLSDNTASDEGGAIYFECFEDSSDNCQLVVSATDIKGNSARVGGGIRWTYREPTVRSSSNVESNTASVYG